VGMTLGAKRTKYPTREKPKNKKGGGGSGTKIRGGSTFWHLS